jgi:NarL family two-component system response regulator LiaR
VTERRSIAVLIVDDHAVVREGIRALLETEADIRVVGQAANGREAVETAARTRPDVVLMDLVMPEMDGVEATAQLKRLDPDVEILVLTSFGGDDKLFPAVRAGALGYLIKDAEPEELVRAVREAAAGTPCLDPAVARRILRQVANEEEESAPAKDLLSERERDVLRLLAHGLSNERIARRLYISEATVRTHVTHILTKLELTNRTQAALYALRVGIASLEETGSE